jgi:hypothetical protein
MSSDHETLRVLLCRLGDEVRNEIDRQRIHRTATELADVVGRVAADVTYEIDRVTEDTIVDFFAADWPRDQPVRLVMEGIEDDRLVVFPEGTPADAVRWVCIVDPIDGTRNLMFDKRSGWCLAALAPARLDESGRPSARFGDITVAAMTELPTTRQWRADQLSAVRGCGPDGVVATAVDVIRNTSWPLKVSPSTSTSLAHAFSSFTHYHPEGKVWLASVEQDLFDLVWPPDGLPRPIFEDQYLCSAGQLAEVMFGRDRLVGDLRPLAWEALGVSASMSCHPYDICTAIILVELGGVFATPFGGPVDCPLDTTTPVAWVAYANPGLASLVGTPLRFLLSERGVSGAGGLPQALRPPSA